MTDLLDMMTELGSVSTHDMTITLSHMKDSDMASTAKKEDVTLGANQRAQKARYLAMRDLEANHKDEFRAIHQGYKDQFGIKDRETRSLETKKAKAQKALAELDPETRKALLASLK